MQDERNQQAFKDALRSTDPDEVDLEQHEREWKMMWDDDAWDRAREFELFDPEYPVEERGSGKNIGQPCPSDTACPRNGALASCSKRCLRSCRYHTL